jgi:hypothetical protein
VQGVGVPFLCIHFPAARDFFSFAGGGRRTTRCKEWIAVIRELVR